MRSYFYLPLFTILFALNPRNAYSKPTLESALNGDNFYLRTKNGMQIDLANYSDEEVTAYIRWVRTPDRLGLNMIFAGTNFDDLHSPVKKRFLNLVKERFFSSFLDDPTGSKELNRFLKKSHKNRPKMNQFMLKSTLSGFLKCTDDTEFLLKANQRKDVVKSFLLTFSEDMSTVRHSQILWLRLIFWHNESLPEFIGEAIKHLDDENLLKSLIGKINKYENDGFELDLENTEALLDQYIKKQSAGVLVILGESKLSIESQKFLIKNALSILDLDQGIKKHESEFIVSLKRRNKISPEISEEILIKILAGLESDPEKFSTEKVGDIALNSQWIFSTPGDESKLYKLTAYLMENPSENSLIPPLAAALWPKFSTDEAHTYLFNKAKNHKDALFQLLAINGIENAQQFPQSLVLPLKNLKATLDKCLQVNLKIEKDKNF